MLYPNSSFPPPAGRGQGVGKTGVSDFKKTLTPEHPCLTAGSACGRMKHSMSGMKRMHWLLRVCSITVLLASAFALSAPGLDSSTAVAGGSAGQSEAARPQMIDSHTLYLPIIYMHYPVNSPFGLEAGYSLANAKTMQHVQDLGVAWVRMGLRVKWSELQPKESGPILWGKLANFEKELRALRAAGVTPEVVVYDSPHWAVVDGRDDHILSSCAAIATDKFADFAAFMSQLVERYSTPEFGVHYWELGNEVDVDPNQVDVDSGYGCWGDAMDPFYGGGHYGEMLKVVTPAIRAQDPAAQVWIGGLLLSSPIWQPPPGKVGSPQYFLEGILRSGAAPYFDAVPYHWYAWYFRVIACQGCAEIKFDYDDYGTDYWHSWGGGTYGKAMYLKTVMSRYGVVKPLVLNETALGCDPNWTVGCAPALSDGFLQAQADYIVRSALRALKAGVAQTYWFMLEENNWGYVGLLDIKRQPKPVYAAYKNLIAQTQPGEFLGPVDYGNGLEAYAFEHFDGHRVHVVWAFADEMRQIHIPQSKLVAVYSRDGAALPLPVPQNGYYTLNVVFSPTYFVLNP